MSKPRESGWERLKRMGRYLEGLMRYVIEYKPQGNVYSLDSFTDSDYAGDETSRKSTSGGVMNIGDYCVKSWSTTQTLIALSGGEAEFYSLTRCAAMSMGIRSLLNDLGLDLDIRAFTDATTGKAIASRRGLGKVRHIATNE